MHLCMTRESRGGGEGMGVGSHIKDNSTTVTYFILIIQ